MYFWCKNDSMDPPPEKKIKILNGFNIEHLLSHNEALDELWKPLRVSWEENFPTSIL